MVSEITSKVASIPRINSYYQDYFIDSLIKYLQTVFVDLVKIFTAYRCHNILTLNGKKVW